MSASTETKASKEVITLTVTVELLFSTESVSTTEVKEMSQSSANLSFSGYSTLDQAPSSCSLEIAATAPTHLQDLQRRANDYLTKVRDLQATVRKLMEELGIADGVQLPLSDCVRLCKSGLVVELLLAPFARLNQYVECF